MKPKSTSVENSHTSRKGFTRIKESPRSIAPEINVTLGWLNDSSGGEVFRAGDFMNSSRPFCGFNFYEQCGRRRPKQGMMSTSTHNRSHTKTTLMVNGWASLITPADVTISETGLSAN